MSIVARVFLFVKLLRINKIAGILALIKGQGGAYYMISEKDLGERIYNLVEEASSSASGPLTKKDIKTRIKAHCPDVGGPDIDASIKQLVEEGKLEYYHSGYPRLVPVGWPEH